MDLQMPVLDGFEATAAIRERERSSGAHLPIVAVTAHAMKGDAERCLAAGMDAYVAKPLRPRDLQAAIERVTAGIAAAPVSESAPATAPGTVVDAPRLLERVGHDRGALARLVHLFLADYPKQLARIRRAVAARDPKALRAAAHALKGAVSNFAAPGATEAALRLQLMGDGGSVTGARSATALLEGELTRVHEALTTLVPRAAGKKAATRRRAPRTGRPGAPNTGTRRSPKTRSGARSRSTAKGSKKKSARSRRRR